MLGYAGKESQFRAEDWHVQVKNSDANKIGELAGVVRQIYEAPQRSPFLSPLRGAASLFLCMSS